MALEKFKLASLVTMDEGRLREAWEQALRRAYLDCEDRPGTDKARKVQLVATLTPIQDPAGGMDSCNVSFEVQDTLPKRCSPIYNMLAGRGGLFYNELSKDDVHQMSLDETGPRRSETLEGQDEENKAHAR